MSKYTIDRIDVEAEYGDAWETVMSIELTREDGAVGTVWIVAGVEPRLRKTSDDARTRTGYEGVRVYGDTPDCWCPESFDPGDIGDIIDAVYDRAMLTYEQESRQRAVR